MDCFFWHNPLQEEFDSLYKKLLQKKIEQNHAMSRKLMSETGGSRELQGQNRFPPTPTARLSLETMSIGSSIPTNQPEHGVSSGAKSESDKMLVLTPDADSLYSVSRESHQQTAPDISSLHNCNPDVCSLDLSYEMADDISLHRTGQTTAKSYSSDTGFESDLSDKSGVVYRTCYCCRNKHHTNMKKKKSILRHTYKDKCHRKVSGRSIRNSFGQQGNYHSVQSSGSFRVDHIDDQSGNENAKMNDEIYEKLKISRRDKALSCSKALEMDKATSCSTASKKDNVTSCSTTSKKAKATSCSKTLGKEDVLISDRTLKKKSMISKKRTMKNNVLIHSKGGKNDVLFDGESGKDKKVVCKEALEKGTAYTFKETFGTNTSVLCEGHSEKGKVMVHNNTPENAKFLMYNKLSSKYRTMKEDKTLGDNRALISHKTPTSSSENVKTDNNTQEKKKALRFTRCSGKDIVNVHMKCFGLKERTNQYLTGSATDIDVSKAGISRQNPYKKRKSDQRSEFPNKQTKHKTDRSLRELCNPSDRNRLQTAGTLGRELSDRDRASDLLKMSNSICLNSFSALQSLDKNNARHQTPLVDLFSERECVGRQTHASQGLEHLSFAKCHSGGIWQAIISES